MAITGIGFFNGGGLKPLPKERLYWCKFKNSEGYLFENTLKNKVDLKRLGFIKVIFEKESKT